MKFYNYLQEKRSHADKNPKISIVDALYPYKDRDDVYISYTDINKLGINPQSKFSTPLGIFVYPLKEMWDQILDDTVPFASKRDYVQCFSAKSKKIQEVSKYTKAQFLKDDMKLEKLYWPLIKKKYPNNQDVISDNWIDWVYHEIYKFAKYVSGNSYIGKMWYLTKTLSEIIVGNKPEINIITKWNSILRKDLGYEGFTDKTGLGVIHPSEPVQAVFLSTKPIKMIDSFINRRYEDTFYEKPLPNEDPYDSDDTKIEINSLSELYNIIKDLKKKKKEIKPYWDILYDAITYNNIIMSEDAYINFKYWNDVSYNYKDIEVFITKMEKLLGVQYPMEHNLIYQGLDSKLMFQYLLLQLKKSDKNKNDDFIDEARGNYIVMKTQMPTNKDLIDDIKQEFKNLNVKWMKSHE